MTLPILYSFRRCPYAMRARMSLAYAGISVEIREVALKAMPETLLALSPKATVPVLQLANGEVLEESLDITWWALSQSDPDRWLEIDRKQAVPLIKENDGPFKQNLDRYKYFTEYPEQPRALYRSAGAAFLKRLEEQLSVHQGVGLLRDSTSLVDIAIFPFVRQFAGADPDWFINSPYPRVKDWLRYHVGSSLFKCVMKKRDPWIPTDTPQIETWH